MSEEEKPAGRAQRTLIAAGSKPYLPRHIKLRQDAARGAWTILAPERVFTPDEIAVAVLQLCDGARTVDAIAQELSVTYNAPVVQISADIVSMLQDLADKGVVKT
jgi:pyrroloquinoline quinone biosynthesis protein D